MLAAQGPMRPAALRDAAEVPKAQSIVTRDVYGWFERVARGLYGLTPAGHAALVQFGWPAPADGTAAAATAASD
jgi:hypothetical protein